eukprot:gene10533-biopygen138
MMEPGCPVSFRLAFNDSGKPCAVDVVDPGQENENSKGNDFRLFHIQGFTLRLQKKAEPFPRGNYRYNPGSSDEAPVPDEWEAGVHADEWEAGVHTDGMPDPDFARGIAAVCGIPPSAVTYYSTVKAGAGVWGGVDFRESVGVETVPPPQSGAADTF